MKHDMGKLIETICGLPFEAFNAVGGKCLTWIAVSASGEKLGLVKASDSFLDLRVVDYLAKLKNSALPAVIGSAFIKGLGRKCEIFEYVEGSSLADHAGNIEPKKLAILFAELFDLLYFLRQPAKQELWHLDIKPSNIIITNEDCPVLIDFASAMITEKGQEYCNKPESDLFKNRLSCTAVYSAPELQTASPHSGSDVFALSVAFLVCFLDLKPDAASRLNRTELSASLSEELAGLLSQALQSDPAQRPLPEKISLLLREYARPPESPDNPDLLQMPDQAGFTEIADKTCKTLCVWQSCELASELAVYLGETGRKVLLIDANWLDTRSDMLLGNRRIDSASLGLAIACSLDNALSLAMSGKLTITALESVVSESVYDNVSLLAPSGSFDFYEKELAQALAIVIYTGKQLFDNIIITAGSFVYDEITCAALNFADIVLACVHGNAAAIRAQGRALTFLKFRQLADADKVWFAVYDYDPGRDLSKSLILELCRRRVVGFVKYRRRHSKHKLSGLCSQVKLDGANRKEYRKIVGKLEL